MGDFYFFIGRTGIATNLTFSALLKLKLGVPNLLLILRSYSGSIDLIRRKGLSQISKKDLESPLVSHICILHQDANLTNINPDLSTLHSRVIRNCAME
jgi:hypothetical protein